MRLMDWLKAFGEDTSADPMPALDQVMWFRLLLLDNSLMWREWFGCSDRRLQTLCGINSSHAITVAKNRLKQRGWLDFKAGAKKTTLYKMTLPDYLRVGAERGADVGAERGADVGADVGAERGADVGALNRLDKTRLDKTKKEKCKKENTHASLLESCLESYTDNAELLEALRGFVEMRREKGRSLTKRALRLNLSKLDKLSSTDEEKIAIVNETVMRGWLGFFPLKQEVKQHGAGRNDSREALEERYSDFVEADRNYIPPWKLRPPGGGDQAASGGDCGH